MPEASVLIVEDEAMTALFLETMLKRRGYNVLERVSSGEEAVDFALQFFPDVVIMDIRLAGKMDGIEAVEKIKAETVKAIQFIFTTGYSDIELRDRADKLNPLGFFIKPVVLTELINVIKKYFSERST